MIKFTKYNAPRRKLILISLFERFTGVKCMAKKSDFKRKRVGSLVMMPFK